MLLLEIADHPFPIIERFRVWIVDPKNSYALLHPEFNDALQLLPERAPMRRFELEWIDVFILLRRIFRVLNRSIRPPSEPFGMFLYIRMVR